MRNLICILIVTFSITAQAQTVADALRYSNLEVGGTARTVGLGGAIGAFGADYSTLSTNPAGLAAYRSDEFVLTPSVNSTRTSSLLDNGNGNLENAESFTSFNFSNVGLVLNYQPRFSKFKTFNLGIGYNRLGSFNQEFLFEGRSSGTIVDRFTELANDGVYDQFEVELADQTLAIYSLDPGTPNDPSDDFYTNDFEDPGTEPGYQVQSEQYVKSKGSYAELVFALAANYDEKLMFGATVGVPFINYEQEKIYKENDVDESIAFFNDLEFQENVTTTAVGINLKLGLIYRINQMFRVGGAFHTPTYLRMEDAFSTELTYDFTDGNGNAETNFASPEGSFDYKLITPMRVMGNLGVLIDKKGFVTMDIEYVDYSSSYFNLTTNSSSIEDEAYELEVNDGISTQYTSAINLRLGGEYALNNLRFRAGYALSGTPYADSKKTNNAYSLGFGVRKRTFYIDLAYRYSQREEQYTPYLLSNPAQEQMVSNDVAVSNFLFTAGFRF